MSHFLSLVPYHLSCSSVLQFLDLVTIPFTLPCYLTSLELTSLRPSSRQDGSELPRAPPSALSAQKELLPLVLHYVTLTSPAPPTELQSMC